jgi:hypothetical protein
MDNGRVDTLTNGNFKQYGLFEHGNNKISELSREAIIGIHQSTPLNQMFFSVQNVQALQLGIRNLVAQRSQGEFVIGMQSEVELQVVMRAVYLQEAKHLTYGIVEQVRALNKEVLDFCVPRIIEEIRMFKYYKNDVSKLPTPLDRGEFSSSKGLRVLETKQL